MLTPFFLDVLECVYMVVMRTIFVFLLLLLPTSTFAWEPRLVSEEAVVLHPEVAQIFYDTLIGEPRAYRMTSDVVWTLSLSLLAPANKNPNGKFDAIVVNESNGTVASVLEAGSTLWEPYYDVVGVEHYARGPKLEQELPPGAYRIMVTSSGNIGRYALAIGEKDEFSFNETIAKITLLPRLKKDFFASSPSTLLGSPLFLGYGAILLVLGTLIGVYAKKNANNIRFSYMQKSGYRNAKNIDLIGRSVRLLIGLILFLFAIFTTWNPLLIAAAGFCFYEAAAGWCAVFSVLGRSSCPIE